MKNFLLRSVTMLFVLVAHSTTHSQDCDSVLQRTVFDANSKTEFIQRVMEYYEAHHNSQTDSRFGLDFGATVPIKGVPVPMNLKHDRANFSKELNDAISKYERETQLKLESNIKFSFIPQAALEKWMRCKELPYLYGDIEIEPKFTPQGKTIVVNLSLKPRSQDARIKRMEVSSGGRTYNTQALRRKLGLRPSDLWLRGGDSFAFTFDRPTPTSDFRFFLHADGYPPVTAYFPVEKPLTILPMEERKNRIMRCLEGMPENFQKELMESIRINEPGATPLRQLQNYIISYGDLAIEALECKLLRTSGFNYTACRQN